MLRKEQGYKMKACLLGREKIKLSRSGSWETTAFSINGAESVGCPYRKQNCILTPVYTRCKNQSQTDRRSKCVTGKTITSG